MILWTTYFWRHAQWLHMIVRSRWWHDIPQMENGFCRQQLALKTNFQAELSKVYIENSSKLKWFDIIGWWDDLSLYWFLSNFENHSILYFFVFDNSFLYMIIFICTPFNKLVSFIVVWLLPKWYILYELLEQSTISNFQINDFILKIYLVFVSWCGT